MQVLSNELKAVAVLADISEEGSSITRDQCMAVEHFHYRCARKRDTKGHTYASCEPVELSFDVRINAADQAKPFYQHLTSGDDDTVLSFLFNATFSATKRLATYEQAMAVNGFIVDVQEIYHSASPIDDSEEQIILRARMLVRSIIYVEDDNQRTLQFVE